MKALRLLASLLGTAAVPTAALAAAAKTASDLSLPPQREQAVEIAQQLTRPPAPAAVPTDLVSPFNPTNFDQPDPDEQKTDPGAGGPRTASAGGPAGGGNAAPASNRELLEAIAARIQPTGSFIIGGEPLLTFPNAKRVRKGNVITVSYNDQTYDLELVAIDRTTFTLRYRGEEITRPIKPTK
ncbi:MAG TPA: hypothetical protein VHD62_06010 [Opitutaceae bacterium]|nr:hypothetical protein [Opitutaceae bacterium]